MSTYIFKLKNRSFSIELSHMKNKLQAEEKMAKALPEGYSLDDFTVAKKEPCPYCHQGKLLIDTLHYKYPFELGRQLGQAVHIEGDRLIVEEETTEVRKINYCPICGRRLGYEAN